MPTFDFEYKNAAIVLANRQYKNKDKVTCPECGSYSIIYRVFTYKGSQVPAALPVAPAAEVGSARIMTELMHL